MGLSIPIGDKKVRGPMSEVRSPKIGVRSPMSDVQSLSLVPRTSDFGHRTVSNGFTLIELMVVITIILILASFAMPSYHVAVIHSREAVLRDDLFTMRKMIDEYTVDKQHPPSSLDELVDAGYLRGGVPVDPFTGSNQTWKTDIEDVPITPDQATAGIVDVHSGAEDTSLDGTPYASW
jgi:general secretion pathway protein G